MRESAVGSEVGELSAERLAGGFDFLEPAHVGELLSRAFAAICDSRTKSSQFFVKGIGHGIRFNASAGAMRRRPNEFIRLVSATTAANRSGSVSRIVRSALDR